MPAVFLSFLVLFCHIDFVIMRCRLAWILCRLVVVVSWFSEVLHGLRRSCCVFGVSGLGGCFGCLLGLLCHIRHQRIQSEVDAFCFFGGKCFAALAVRDFLSVDTGCIVACQRGKDEAVVLPVKDCQGEGKLVSCVIESVVYYD